MNNSDAPEQTTVDIQIASQHQPLPTAEQFTLWVSKVLANLKKQHSEITIRIVDEEESQALNTAYRQKNTPTNVLSFASELPDFIDHPLLGDLIICAPVVTAEAKQQNKHWQAHWAHLTIHGTLHLLGYDHITEQEAELMEGIEIDVLASLGIDDPYRDNQP